MGWQSLGNTISVLRLLLLLILSIVETMRDGAKFESGSENLLLKNLYCQNCLKLFCFDPQWVKLSTIFLFLLRDVSP